MTNHFHIAMCLHASETPFKFLKLCFYVLKQKQTKISE